MQELYIIHNQDGYFLGKNGEWLDGREPTQLYRCQHKDEAINELFEAGSKNYELRLSIMECGIKQRMVPDIPEDKLPPALIQEEVADSIAHMSNDEEESENNETDNLFSEQVTSSSGLMVEEAHSA